ncbi:head-tail joining protein [Rhodovulum adriaticum]|nr:hypothetical protein [Rhodovulum adriaticum]MBK1634367.1 hypothetical protein [Rhodovulum adriaticum]
MPDALSAALTALFADPNIGRDAVYIADGGVPVLVRIVTRRGDAVTDFGNARLWTEGKLSFRRVFPYIRKESADRGWGDVEQTGKGPSSSAADRDLGTISSCHPVVGRQACRDGSGQHPPCLQGASVRSARCDGLRGSIEAVPVITGQVKAMPLTAFQYELMRLLASSKTRSAYLAGGSISSLEGRRFSDDIDYFHDSAAITVKTYEIDCIILSENGYVVTPITETPGFVRAVVSRGTDAVKVDWAHEAAWHFFAPVMDPEFGFRLHWADAATNKILAFASRRESRDVFDVLQWHETRLPLGILIWAASGKNAGLPPGLILEEIRRNARISPGDLSVLNVEGGVDPVDIAKRFREAVREAEALLEVLPPESAGHLFLCPDGTPTKPDLGSEAALSRRIAPTLGGLMPVLHDEIPTPD